MAEKILTSKGSVFTEDTEEDIKATIVTEKVDKPKFKPKKPSRPTITIYKDDAEYIYTMIKDITKDAVNAISVGNANALHGAINNILKEYRKKILK